LNIISGDRQKPARLPGGLFSIDPPGSLRRSEKLGCKKRKATTANGRLIYSERNDTRLSTQQTTQYYSHMIAALRQQNYERSQQSEA
jgi:hypothetical protein